MEQQQRPAAAALDELEANAGDLLEVGCGFDALKHGEESPALFSSA
jgi:hypothetical protein